MPTQNETQDKTHSIANTEALNPTTKDIKTKSQIPFEIVGYCNLIFGYLYLVNILILHTQYTKA